MTRELNNKESALLSTVHWSFSKINALALVFLGRWPFEECFMKILHTEFNIGSSSKAAATLLLRLSFFLSTIANPMASANKAMERTSIARIANLFCFQKSFRDRLFPSENRLLLPKEVSFAVSPRTIDWFSSTLSSALASHERSFSVHKSRRSRDELKERRVLFMMAFLQWSCVFR